MLNDLLKNKLEIAVNDDLLLKALRALFNEEIERLKPEVIDENNDLLGEKYRAYVASCNLIEEAFRELESYKVNLKSKPKFSKER